MHTHYIPIYSHCFRTLLHSCLKTDMCYRLARLSPGSFPMKNLSTHCWDQPKAFTCCDMHFCWWYIRSQIQSVSWSKTAALLGVSFLNTKLLWKSWFPHLCFAEIIASPHWLFCLHTLFSWAKGSLLAVHWLFDSGHNEVGETAAKQNLTKQYEIVG